MISSTRFVLEVRSAVRIELLFPSKYCIGSGNNLNIHSLHPITHLPGSYISFQLRDKVELLEKSGSKSKYFLEELDGRERELRGLQLKCELLEKTRDQVSLRNTPANYFIFNLNEF